MASLLPPFQLPSIRIPLVGILGQQQLPKPKQVTAAFAKKWGVYYNNTLEPVFIIDSVIDIDYHHANKVSSFPVEKGAFATYNKVNEPRTIKVRLAVHGGNKVSAFLSDLEDELVSTNLYQIVMPERVYKNMTLEKVPFSRKGDKSVDQIVVDLTFIEVVEVAFQSVGQAVIKSAKKAKDVPKPPAAPVAVKPPVDIKPPINPLVGHHF